MYTRELRPRPHRHPRRSILLADHDVPFAEVIGYRLEREGHDLARAADGEEALDRIADGEFEAVIAAVDLPGAGAIELRDRAREICETPPPFLALVPHGRREDLLRGLSEGLADCVEKPVSPEEILVRLRRILE